MKPEILKRLKALDTDQLAEALFELAADSCEAESVVNRLTRTTDEAFQGIKKSISSLKQSSRHVGWSGAKELATSMSSIVEDIRQTDMSSIQRFELICRFIETDSACFEQADDSSGYLGDVYRYEATIVFTDTAAQMVDKQVVTKELEILLASNEYGARDELLDKADLYLNEQVMRELASRFHTLSEQTTNEYKSKSWLGHVETLAAQLGDTTLYERVALEAVANFDAVPVVTRYRIAQNYFNHQQVDEALSWMDKIDSSELFMQRERDALLISIHEAMGNTDKRDGVALSLFNKAPSKHALEKLLKVIGESHRETLMAEQLARIIKSERFSGDDLDFLLALDELPLAEQYVVKQRASINGDFYWNLPDQAALFRKAGYLAAAICIYRALLNSVLLRGKTPTYGHGVGYLKALDTLADLRDGGEIESHALYKAQLLEIHGRKRSFWTKYQA